MNKLSIVEIDTLIFLLKKLHSSAIFIETKSKIEDIVNLLYAYNWYDKTDKTTNQKT